MCIRQDFSGKLRFANTKSQETQPSIQDNTRLSFIQRTFSNIFWLQARRKDLCFVEI